MKKNTPAILMYFATFVEVLHQQHKDSLSTDVV